MKIFIAYALVVSGIPIFVGLIFGQILILPIVLIARMSRGSAEKSFDDAQGIAEAAEAAAKFSIAWMLSGSTKMPVKDIVVHTCLDVFNGFGAVLAAALLFHFFNLPLRLAVLLLLAAWEIFFTVSYGQSFRALFSSLAGLLVGWFVVLRLFSF